MRLFNLITFLLSLLIFAVFVFLAIDTVRAQPIGEWDPFSIHLNGDNDSSISAVIDFPFGLSLPTTKEVLFGSDITDGNIAIKLANDGFKYTLSYTASESTTLDGTVIVFNAGHADNPSGTGGFIDFLPGRGNTSGGNGGYSRIRGGQGYGAGNSGGKIFLLPGAASSGANYGFVSLNTGANVPDKFTLTDSLTRVSQYIQGNLEVDGTTWLDGNALVGGTLNVTGATTLATSLTGILKGTSGLVAVASSSDILTAIGTIDISSNTNLAVTSPITLTGDTLGFDFSTNNTWTGTQQLNNTLTMGVNGTGHDFKAFGDTSGAYVEWDADTSVLNVFGDGTLRALDVKGNVRMVGNGGTPLASVYDVSVQGGGAFAYLEILNQSSGANHGFFFGSSYISTSREDAEIWSYGGSDKSSGDYPIVSYGGWGSPQIAYNDRLRHSWYTSSSGTPSEKLRLDTAEVKSYVNFKIGNGVAATDYTLTFDGQSADGLITWMEDEDYFLFADSILFNDSEPLYFGTGVDASILYDGTNLVINPKLVGTGYVNIAGGAVLSEDLVLASTKKIYLEGAGSDTYIYYDSGSSSIKFYVNGVLAAELK